MCGRSDSCGYQPLWLQYLFFFFCICGTPQYEKVLGSSGPYLKCRWRDLYGVVGIQPPFPARAGVTNSTRHTSFHTACQICGIRCTHTLLTCCCLLDWSSVLCARQLVENMRFSVSAEKQNYVSMHPSSPPPLPPETPLPKLMPFGSSGPGWWSAEIKQSFECVCNGRKVAAMRQIYNLGIVAEVNFCYPLLGDQDPWNLSCLFQILFYFWHYNSSVPEGKLFEYLFQRGDQSLPT